MKRWDPRVEPTSREKQILKRLKRHRRLFSFLRLHRHELLDARFQDELATMYRNSGAGSSPTPPALLCLVVLLQAYVQASDAEAVELALMDARWQMVLDCLGTTDPPFCQACLQQFRERLIAHDMDRRLLEATVDLAKKTEEFGWKNLPKDLRIGVDSRPLSGAGRVEDIFNLLGHAARKIAETASLLLEIDYVVLCRDAGIPLLLAPSIKAGLDVDWSDDKQKTAALNELDRQVNSLTEWVQNHMSGELKPLLQLLARVKNQNLHTRADGTVQKREGVAPDRVISIEDPEMRHGRKSKSKRFNGYKEHVAADMDTKLVLACSVTPANAPEANAGVEIREELKRQDVSIGELDIDRGYITSVLVEYTHECGGEVVCKPWSVGKNKSAFFTKDDFHMDFRSKTITCPNGETEPFVLGQTVHFDLDACESCAFRERCTSSGLDSGRSVHIAQDEKHQRDSRDMLKTKTGRARFRQRTPIEHRLAHIANRKGPRARYWGARKNLFDLRRTAAVQNLETTQMAVAGPARRAA
jgi:hypothetical protein